MASSSREASGVALALASAGCYGFNIVTTRLAAIAGVSGVALVFYRVLLMLALIAAAAALLRLPLRIARGEGASMVALGLSTMTIGVSYLSSVAFIPVTVAVVIFYTFPALIVLASPFVEGRRLDAVLLLVVALSLVGVGLVVGPAARGLDWRGVALAGLASLATTVQFFTAARCRRTGIVAKVFWIHLVVLPAAGLVGLLTGTLGGPGALGLAPLAVALTIAGYVAGFLMQLSALARVSAVPLGIAYCLEPVVAALTSVAILGEALSPLQLVGGGLVLAAIAASVLRDRRRPAAPACRPAALEAAP